ncbi:MAG: 30S ribosomal protein S20 [Patescibacteria group bacterium]
MPITKSAKKALRQSKKRRVLNIRRKKAIKVSTKQIKKLLQEKKPKDALAILPTTYKAIDKAAKAGTIKKNTANRKKSRLAKQIGKISTA